MGADMASVRQIEKRLIQYFAWYLDKPASWFSRDTPVRRAFRYTEAWMTVADRLSEAKWMNDIRVRLSQRDMLDVSTIGELADLIASKSGRRIQRLAAKADRPVWLA
jgi:hypothetical protein